MRRWRWIWGRVQSEAGESASVDPAEVLTQPPASMPMDASTAVVQGEGGPGELSNTPNNFPNMHAERLPRAQVRHWQMN